jgi:hypothetical protein
MKNYWVRFFMKAADHAHFEYHGPWWVSGYTADCEQEIVCAAVRARGAGHAAAIINAAFDARHKPVKVDFVEMRPEGWEPFCDRFGRRDWMQWPEVTGRNAKASKQNVKAAYGEEVRGGR